VAQPAVKPAAPHPDQGKLRRKIRQPDALALADTDADGPSYDGAYTGADRAAYAPPDAGSDNRSEPSEGGVARAARCRRLRVASASRLRRRGERADDTGNGQSRRISLLARLWMLHQLHGMNLLWSVNTTFRPQKAERAA
jgi:hypothetical protein